MSAPIYDKLRNYKNKNVYPWHMPGHKGCEEWGFGSDLIKMDITEIPDFDNLNSCEGIILDSQRMCAKTFGADKSYFLVNGSTCGIQAAIMSVCNDGEKIIVARNCHRSVYSGLVFSGAIPVYIMPEIINDFNLAGGISVEEVRKVIGENPYAKAFIMVSPTFEGFVSNIGEIAKIVHDNNMVLIVDEAHGSHMKFDYRLPKTALEEGADIVIHSLHKTLPVMTQCSCLHVKGKNIDINRLKLMLSLLQTSSPSYVFMACMDRCREFLDREGSQAFDNYVQLLIEFRNKLSDLKTIKLLSDEIIGTSSVFEIDMGKLVFYINAEKYSGFDLEKELLLKYKIQIEMSSLKYIIAMSSVVDKKEAFDSLAYAIKEIDFRLTSENYSVCFNKPQFNSISMPLIRIIPREAMSFKSKFVGFDNSIGRISAEFIIVYPPGIPLLVPGEEISSDIVHKVNSFLDSGYNIIGMSNENSQYIKVLDDINK